MHKFTTNKYKSVKCPIKNDENTKEREKRFTFLKNPSKEEDGGTKYKIFPSLEGFQGLKMEFNGGGKG